MANRYRRWWLPNEPGGNRGEGMPDYTGDCLDGFGNRMTVYAVANSTLTPPEILAERRRTNPKLNDQAYHLVTDRQVNCDGYGIVRLAKREQTNTMECWRWDADASNPNDQFAGWPKTIKVSDNDGRKPADGQ